MDDIPPRGATSVIHCDICGLRKWRAGSAIRPRRPGHKNRGRFWREDADRSLWCSKCLVSNGLTGTKAAQSSMEYLRAVNVGAPAARHVGFVYVMTNPAWPEHCKIGKARDPLSRLNTFNCGCPHRAYRFECVFGTNDMGSAEARAHVHLNDKRTFGEWFLVTPEEAIAETRAILSSVDLLASVHLLS